MILEYNPFFSSTWYSGYQAPMQLYMDINSQRVLGFTLYMREINVCVGKEWYRYSSSFFLPDNRILPLRARLVLYNVCHSVSYYFIIPLTNQISCTMSLCLIISSFHWPFVLFIMSYCVILCHIVSYCVIICHHSTDQWNYLPVHVHVLNYWRSVKPWCHDSGKSRLLDRFSPYHPHTPHTHTPHTHTHTHTRSCGCTG